MCTISQMRQERGWNPQLIPYRVARDTPRSASVNRRHRTTVFTSIAALASLTFVGAGCGGSDDGDSTTAFSRRRRRPSAGSDQSPVSTVVGLTQDHVEGSVDYPQRPPIGGDHNPAWQNCGVYREPIVDENAVHSLEHGAVWITYQPDLAAADVATLEALADGQTHVLVSPYPDLKRPVILTAWGAQQGFDSADDPGIADLRP